MHIEPLRILFVNKNQGLLSEAKQLFDEKAKEAPLELICYQSVERLDHGFYINYDLAFVGLGELVNSSFIQMNREHYNWGNMKLVLLVDKFSAEHLTKLYETLDNNNLKLELDYITTDSYSNKLICAACSQYCIDLLNLRK